MSYEQRMIESDRNTEYSHDFSRHRKYEIVLFAVRAESSNLVKSPAKNKLHSHSKHEKLHWDSFACK